MQRLLILVAVAVILVAAFAAAMRTATAPSSVGLRTPIRQDDFTYTVVGAVSTPRIANGGRLIHARGAYVVVTIAVANQARIVAFTWSPDIVRLVDASGRSLAYDRAAQALIDGAADRTWNIAHGDVARFAVAFDVPPDFAQPSVAFSNGLMMGDVFDGGAYLRARVPLRQLRVLPVFAADDVRAGGD
jgi:hypothetical protein